MEAQGEVDGPKIESAMRMSWLSYSSQIERERSRGGRGKKADEEASVPPWLRSGSSGEGQEGGGGRSPKGVD